VKPVSDSVDGRPCDRELSIFVRLARANQTNRVFGSRLIPEMTYFGVSTRLLRQFYLSDNAIESYKFSQELSLISPQPATFDRAQVNSGWVQ